MAFLLSGTKVARFHCRVKLNVRADLRRWGYMKRNDNISGPAFTSKSLEANAQHWNRPHYGKQYADSGMKTETILLTGVIRLRDRK